MEQLQREIEKAVLGICLLEKNAFGRTYGLIDEAVFYYEDHKKIYTVIREMYDRSLPVDHITVWQKQEEKNIVLSAGLTSWYLCELSMHVVASTHLEYHCHLLKQAWKKRELEKLTRSGIDLSEDPQKQGYSINERINEILGSEAKQDWYSMDELMFQLMVHQQEIASGKKEFVTTGFRAIDKLNGGFTPGQLIIVGARPSVGKSALMGLIAAQIARKNKKVGIVSLEMNNTEIAARLASLDTDTDFGIIYRNLFRDEREQERWYNTVTSKTINLPIYVSDKTKVDVGEIKAKAIKLKHKHGLDMLMVDYLQLVESSGNKNYNREQEVARISRGLKLMAMDMQIPVMVLCQLNRAVTSRKGKDRHPQLSDLRESGAIEQDADVVLMLHRDWMSGVDINPESGMSTEKEADLLGVKWRNGATFILPLDFDPQKMKFSEQASTNLSQMNYPKEDNDEDPF